MDELLKYWPIVATVIMVLWGWAMWSARSSFASKADLAAVDDANDKRFNAVEKDILIHKQRLEMLPSSKDVSEVTIKLTELHGDHKALRAEMDGMKKGVEVIDRSVTRIEKFLINTGAPR